MARDLPAPLTPADCDLRDFPFMPLDVLRLRDSDLAAVEDAEAFRAAVLLWCVAWHQTPAASLPDDDAVLCRLAGYGRDRATWLRAKEGGALRGFVLCSDGRLYHRVVAEKANEAWDKKKSQRERGKRGNEARWGRRRPAAGEVADGAGETGGGGPTAGAEGADPNAAAIAEAIADASQRDPRSNPSAIPGGSLSDPVSNPSAIAEAIADASPEDRKGQGQGEGQGEVPSLRSGAPDAPEPDPKRELWAEGLRIIAELTDATTPSARKLLGKLAQEAEAAKLAPADLLAVLREAERVRPVDPIPWFRAAIAGRRRGETDDPWGARAWIAKLPDQVGGKLNGYPLTEYVRLACEAAGIPPTARPRLDAVAEWCRADLDISDDVTAGIARKAAELGSISSLKIFDETVRKLAPPPVATLRFRGAA